MINEANWQPGPGEDVPMLDDPILDYEPEEEDEEDFFVEPDPDEGWIHDYDPDWL